MSESEAGHSAQSAAIKLAQPEHTGSKPFVVLGIAVLAVVYGDTGTSPIYAYAQNFCRQTPDPG